MSRKCAVCGKTAMTGNRIQRRGMAKSKGGVGKKTTGITKRRFFPNLQPKRVLIKGKVKRVLLCAKCIKGNKAEVPSRSRQTHTTAL